MSKKPHPARKTKPRSGSAKMYALGKKPILLWVTPGEHAKLKATAIACKLKVTQYILLWAAYGVDAYRVSFVPPMGAGRLETEASSSSTKKLSTSRDIVSAETHHNRNRDYSQTIKGAKHV